MGSLARQERRLAREQDTIGAQRAERREQEKLGSQSNLEVVVTKAKQQDRERERNAQPAFRQRRTARPGKPLKR